ncbi:MAG TPA: MFS transporter [Solirubrobacteraceae bacterium]|nr:MFS transporter [Solirubrobacteraceae bacterium]
MQPASAPIRFGTIRTQIPGRLDRLPWSRFHWRIVAGLGTVWVLDGLEVTIVGSIGARLTEPGSGISMTTAGIGLAAALYVAGACCGALFFGQLTDRFGRKRLMILTLAVYICATVLTAFAFAPWYFFLCRFLTGAGIGGEYAAINSAIDELIPARNRGQVDITINGSYWVGSAVGGLAALAFLDTALFPQGVGWRLSFAVGAVLGLAILLVRRTVPESPRWLFIHGREAEAERIVDEVEQAVRAQTHRELAPPAAAITVRQRASIPFREIARVALRFYPKRVILGLALFVGQAFLYNAVTFNLGTMLSTFYGVASATVPAFIIIFAVGNFLGPLLLGRLFDTVGRKPMIAGTYLVSATLTVLLGILLVNGGLTQWSFIALVGITFFFASAGASAAYLTVSEIFPMETRALAIALFYAVGTGAGGIVGPLIFGNLITGGQSAVAVGFFIGAAVMAIGGAAALLFGVRAERMPLENIAKPLTVVDAERATATAPASAPAVPPDVSPEHLSALRDHERAEEERARAAEHRAAAHELAADALGATNGAGARQDIEEVLADIAELRAKRLDELAISHDERANADRAGDDLQRHAGLERAAAAQERARIHKERAEALAAEHDADSRMHVELAEAASERALAREQRALADEARSHARQARGADATLAGALAARHDAWEQMHTARALAHRSHAEGNNADAERQDREAEAHQERALAADERVDAAGRRVAVAALQREEGAVEQSEREREQAAERDRQAGERDERIRRRLARQEQREHEGLRRFLPGPGRTLYSPGMVGTASRWAPTAEQDLDREIAEIARALEERGPTDRDRLAELVGARYWGPGRFRAALDEAVDEGRARRLSRTTYAPSGGG